MLIEERHLRLVWEVFKDYPYTFYVFGSRVAGTAKPLSDLDLCFFEDIPNTVLLKIEAAFEESDLPYKVDLVDARTWDVDFRDAILKNMIRLPKPS